MSLSPEGMKKVGGSDIPAIMGIDPYRTVLSVWMRIIHGVTTPDNPAMRRGRALEPAVLRLYAEETGRTIITDCSDRPLPSPWRISLDGRSYGSDPLARRVVEVKTTGRHGANGWGEPGTDEIPDGYALQVQWYLGWGLRVGRVEDTQADVAALLAGDFALYHVHYDAEVFGVLEDRAARFWRDHVETGRPPEAVPTAQDAALAARIRRVPALPSVDFESLSGVHRGLVRHYLSHVRNADYLAKKRDAEKTELMLAVAGACGITGLPEETGFSRIDWIPRKGRTTTDWEAVARKMNAHWNHSDGPGSLFDDLRKEHTKTSEPTRAWCPVPLKEAKE